MLEIAFLTWFLSNDITISVQTIKNMTIGDDSITQTRVREIKEIKRERADLAENTAEKQRGRPFPKGQSGNPYGRPKGSRNKATLAVQALFDGEAETIGRKAIELAKEGDITAIRLVLERILPARKDSPVNLSIPSITKSEDAVLAVSSIMQSVTNGDITPREGQVLSGIVDSLRKAIETTELEKKLDNLQSILERRK